MQDTITLTLHKKWFDMILSGVKTEEYRDIKPYWIRRLLGNWHQYHADSVFYRGDYLMPFGVNKIRFKNGYGRNAPEFTIEWNGISVDCPNPDWSPISTHNTFVFILKLGNILETKI